MILKSYHTHKIYSCSQLNMTGKPIKLLENNQKITSS